MLSTLIAANLILYDAIALVAMSMTIGLDFVGKAIVNGFVPNKGFEPPKGTARADPLAHANPISFSLAAIIE